MNWNEQTALSVLDLAKLPPPEVLEELLEELVFEKRAYFLQQAIIPRLYRSRVGRLVHFNEAFSFLLGTSTPGLVSSEVEYSQESPDLLEELMEKHVDGIREARLHITQSLNVPIIVAEVYKLCAKQEWFESAFIELTEVGDWPQVKVPLQADQIDLGKALYKAHNAMSIENEIAKERARILAIKK